MMVKKPDRLKAVNGYAVNITLKLVMGNAYSRFYSCVIICEKATLFWRTLNAVKEYATKIGLKWMAKKSIQQIL